MIKELSIISDKFEVDFIIGISKSKEELSDYYEGTLKVKNQEVFVLKVQAIIEKVKKEIAAA